jgi:hypothetical protein
MTDATFNADHDETVAALEEWAGAPVTIELREGPLGLGDTTSVADVRFESVERSSDGTGSDESDLSLWFSDHQGDPLGPLEIQGRRFAAGRIFKTNITLVLRDARLSLRRVVPKATNVS